MTVAVHLALNLRLELAIEGRDATRAMSMEMRRKLGTGASIVTLITAWVSALAKAC